MRLFDLHCDTLYRAQKEDKSLFEPSFQLALNRNGRFSRWVQCMAVWLSDDMSADEGFDLFRACLRRLKTELSSAKIRQITDGKELENSKTPAVILTVENLSLIGNDLNRIDFLAECGVKAATLTWNGENCIGGGAESGGIGLTPFGKQAVKKLEDSGIAIDVSHAGDRLFYDVAKTARKPFFATHSNSRVCTDHRRNLTDEQFKIIRDRRGIVGLNFCDMFLNSTPQKACIADFIRHTEHFLSLGGEDAVALGSDFDGCDVAPDIGSVEGVWNLYNAFLSLNYREDLLDKLFFPNAYDFFCRFL